jgi:hypothetical protein
MILSSKLLVHAINYCMAAVDELCTFTVYSKSMSGLLFWRCTRESPISSTSASLCLGALVNVGGRPSEFEVAIYMKKLYIKV